LSVAGTGLYLWLSSPPSHRENGVFEELGMFTSTHLVLRDGRFFYVFHSDVGGLPHPTVGDYTREGDTFILRTDTGEFGRWSFAAGAGNTLVSTAGVALHRTPKSVDDAIGLMLDLKQSQ
jgi:hypothetical protein